jgi:hypothetical protein
MTMKTINSIDLDSVLGGISQQQKAQSVGNEGLFCGGLAARARSGTWASPASGRKELADLCWDNLKSTVNKKSR